MKYSGEVVYNADRKMDQPKGLGVRIQTNKMIKFDKFEDWNTFGY